MNALHIEFDLPGLLATQAGFKAQLALRTLKLTLGVGESEAIILASEKSADYLILDDWKARQIALSLDLPVVGTVAILNKATEKGLIVDFPIVFENLRLAGFLFY